MRANTVQKSVATLIVASNLLVSAATINLPIVFQNSYASVEVDIGTPPSKYRLHFDTGSSSSWVTDSNCSSTLCPNGSGYQRVGYNASSSSTSTVQGPLSTIVYSSANDYISGLAVTDLFALPVSEPNVSFVSWPQTFLSATQNTWRFVSSDGFLGLAFSTIAATNTTTVFETLMQQNLVDLPRFGIYYGKEFSDTGATPSGVLTLGGSKEDVYVEGNMTWIPLRQESEFQVWRTPFKSISGTYSSVVAGGNASTTTSIPTPISSTLVVSDGRAVFDTGAGGISLPTELIDEVYASIGFNYSAILTGKHRPLCTEFNDSWSISFNFGEWDSYDDRYTITLTGDELARPGFAGSDEFCFPPFNDSGSWGFGLFGTTLLQMRYTTWDFGAKEVSAYEPRLGLGKLKAQWKP